MNEQDGLQLAMLTTAFEGRVDITTADHGRYVAYRVLRKDAERIIAALAASEREQRNQTALDYIKAVAREVANGETSRSALRVALAQIDSEEWWKAQEPGPAGPGRGAGGEIDQLREELAETRAHEHVLVIVGDMLARHLEWMIREPTSGFVPEVLDAIKAQSTPDVAQWQRALQNAGFKRPDAPEPAPTGPERGEE